MKNYAVEEDAIHGGGILCIMRKPNSVTVLLLIQAIFYFLSTSPARRLYPNIYQMLQIILKNYLLSIEKMFFFCLLLRFFRLVLLTNSVIWSSDCRERLFFYLISITITYFCSINSQGALRNEVIRWCSV